MTAEQKIEAAEKRLDELEQQIERAGKKAEHALEDLRERSSPPETLHIPEDMNQGPHYPGLG
jgi:hypothetical protein